MEYGIWDGDMGIWAYGCMGIWAYGLGYGIGMGLWAWGGDGVGLGLGYGRMGFGILPNPLVWAASIHQYSIQSLDPVHALYIALIFSAFLVPLLQDLFHKEFDKPFV